MTVKCTGAEWNRFYTDEKYWPDGAWHDDEIITMNGADWDHNADLSRVPADAKMTVAGGCVFMKEDDDDGPSLESHFKRWRKEQTTEFLTVEVPKKCADAVRVAIAVAGGKVTA